MGLQAACLLTAALAYAALAQLPPSPNYPGYALQYEDDFNGPLNTAVWTAQDGYVHTQYDIVCYSAANAYTENGNLILLTKHVSPPVTCTPSSGPPRAFSYTSGWVDTVGKLSVRDGIVEIRAALPPPSFRMWPSGFLISDQNKHDTGLCWPLATEIDMYEVAGGFDGGGGLGSNAMCASYHWGTQCFNDLGSSQTGCLPQPPLDTTAFHTYRVRWGSNYIEWAVDGKVFYVMTSDPRVAAAFPGVYVNAVNGIALPAPDAMNIVIETALAWWIAPQSGAPGDVGIGTGYAKQLVDWVRVWHKA